MTSVFFFFFTMRNKNLTFIYYYYYYLPFRFSFVIKIYERIFNLPNFKKKFINLEKIILFIYFLLTYGNVIVIRKRKLFCQNQRTSSPTPRPFPTLTYKNSDISKTLITRYGNTRFSSHFFQNTHLFCYLKSKTFLTWFHFTNYSL